MKLYSETKEYKLYHGNMLDMLDVIEPNSIDSIICDPPYELNFMNRSWDNSGIAFDVKAWKKCYEVLKPGGFMLAFGGSRTFHRIAVAIEDAGFNIRDIIMYLYGSGFPKSMDISKQIDKKGGNDYSKQFAIDLKQARESRNLTMKYCDDKYCNGSTNWSWYEGRKDGCRVPDYQTYLKIINEFPELEKYKELIKEAEREVIGQREKLESYQYKGNNVYQTNGNKEKIMLNITIPSTDLAKQWQGWGTCLKPAYEPIIVARKPVENSIIDNVMKYGVGGINIDECRVPVTEADEYDLNERPITKGVEHDNLIKFTKTEGYDVKHGVTNSGRYPANVILDDSDEVLSLFPNSKSSGSDYNFESSNQDNTTHLYTNIKSGKHFDDEGNCARFFYCAKASKFDRDEGLDEFQEKKVYGEDVNFGYGNNNGDNLGERIANVTRKNVHPTVKPTELMRYLVRLISPNGATILDCFNGSGSTGKAVMLENKQYNKNYKYIGIELTEEYLPISKARIEYIINNDFDFSIDEEGKSKHEVIKKDDRITIFDFEN